MSTVACLEVSSPRRPCSRVDQRFGRTFTVQGVRAEAARTGAAGIMLRVVQTGSIAEGDLVRVVQRPHPEWSVTKVAALLYGHPTACMMYSTRNVKLSEWMGSLQELHEVRRCSSVLLLSQFPTPFSAVRAATARRPRVERSSAATTAFKLFPWLLVSLFTFPFSPNPFRPFAQLRSMLNEDVPPISPFIIAAAFAATSAVVALQVTTRSDRGLLYSYHLCT
jgi:hypothetical protein